MLLAILAQFLSGSSIKVCLAHKCSNSESEFDYFFPLEELRDCRLFGALCSSFVHDLIDLLYSGPSFSLGD